MMAAIFYGLSLAWLLLSTLSLYSALVWLRGVRNELDTPGNHTPDIIVLLPVRINDREQLELFRDCLKALSQQNYPGHWRAIVAFARQDDPGFQAVVDRNDRRLEPVVAPTIPSTAEKLSNLLAGYAMRKESEGIIVTLDADTAPQPTWLTDLTRPVRSGLARMSSGYRWIVPSGFLARLVSLSDRGVATTMRPRKFNLLWGGPIAITAELAEELDLQSVWTESVSDDLSLWQRARELSEFAWTPLHVLVPSPTRYAWNGLVEFARRQHVLLRMHAPFHWWVLGISLLLPVIALTAVLVAVAKGLYFAWAVMAIAVVLSQIRFNLHMKIAERVLPKHEFEQVLRTSFVDRLLLPVAHLLHAALFLSNATRRRFQWSGKEYEVKR